MLREYGETAVVRSNARWPAKNEAELRVIPVLK